MSARRLVLVLLAAVAAGAVAAGIAVAGKGNGNNKTFEYAIGLWGDMPYSAVQAQTGVPNLIADMNNSDIQFSVNDGDLKAGNGESGNPPSSNCTNELYAQALGWLNMLEQPAMFTAGDNDWTDCDRPSNGGYNSLERLDYERALFFNTSHSLGMQTLEQEVQSDQSCLGYVSGPSTGPTVTKPASCVENRRWEFKNVMYVTVNVQGSCNNLCDTFPNSDEYAARNAADNTWLQQSFAEAKANGDAAVMIIGQADPGFDLTGSPYAGTGPDAPTRDPKTLDPAGINTGKSSGFKDFLTTLRTETIAFRKPVVYVHGDTHYFRVDKPLLDARGSRLENFTRVETFGDNAANGNNDVHWVKALVDPQSRDVFAFQPQIVPANRVAVPSP